MAIERGNRTNEERDYHSFIEKVFERRASLYDFVVYPVNGIRKEVVRLASAAPGSKVLDVATGTGKQAFAFAEAGCDVIGIDINEAMLQVAQKHNHYPNLKLQTADASTLSYGDNSFDITSVAFALHEMPPSTRGKVVSEMVRVTKPGGVLIVSDYGLPHNKILAFLCYHFIKAGEGKYYAEFVRSNLLEQLVANGIEIVTVKTVALHLARIIKGIKNPDVKNAG